MYIIFIIKVNFLCSLIGYVTSPPPPTYVDNFVHDGYHILEHAVHSLSNACIFDIQFTPNYTPLKYICLNKKSNIVYLIG